MRLLKRCCCTVTLLAACLALTACNLPISQHPLTSEMPSLDERLLGTWEVDTSAFHEGEAEPQIATYIVQRLKDDAERLEVVAVQDGVEQASDATKLVTCHYAMHDYFSIGPLNKEAGTAYSICNYRFDDADHGHVFLLDSDFMADAIDRGLLAGEVSRDGARITGVSITAAPADLRRFLAKHSPDCFMTKKPLAARRVK